MNAETKETLQKIAAMIGKFEIEMEQARLIGDYETFKLKRGAAQMAKAEFYRLSKNHRKGVK
jgi:hypothetical protein